MASRSSRGDEPARYRGPRSTAFNMGWQRLAAVASRNRQGRNLEPFDSDLGLCFSVPCAAAGSEWIKGDQRNELSEAIAEFSFCRLSSFRLRGPA